MKSINPANGATIKTYKEHSSDDCNSIIDDVYNQWGIWKQTTIAQRKGLMLNAAKVLREMKPYLARLMTLEMGKLIGEAEAEVEKSAWVCDFYAAEAETFLKDEHIETDASNSFVAFEPLGPVLAVMPWNFPFWQVFRFAAPALMAGNAGLLKHASNVPGCALAIEDVFRKAGFPENLFRTLMIPSRLVEGVIANEKVCAVTLTGSEAAGSNVAETAGKYLKKTVLELGGSDPYIVLADADLEKCAKTAVVARMINAGQSCIAAKRFIVHKDVFDDFIDLAKPLMENLSHGDPLDAETKLAPLARMDLVEDLHDQVQRSVAMGAKVICGGQKIDGEGYFYKPTIIIGDSLTMPIFSEEIFGPVLAVYKVDDDTEAIDVANSSQYGLGGSLWTQDIDKGIRLARQVETGSIFINGMTKSDPRLPFGGIKKSGYGRELSHYGIREFVNIKTVWVG